MIHMRNSTINNSVTADFRAMGTDVSVEIVLGHPVSKGTRGVFEAQETINKIKNIFSTNEKIFSRFREDSELAKINTNLGKEIVVSEKMFEVLSLCIKFYDLSDGYFDPRIIEVLERIGYDKDFKSNDFNSDVEKKINLEKIAGDLQEDLILNSERRTVLVKKRIDTTGIAKGYTVDEAAQYLKAQGFEDYIVNGSGDIMASGFSDEHSVWRIGIEGLDDSKLMLKLENEGIATSGISRKRWRIGEKKVHHLINPKDPENFSYDIKTVTVIEEKTVEADGRAKVLVLMGKEKGLEFANKNNIKALFLDYRGNVYLSNEIKKNIL
ncbi:MAG: Membrane-associated lipoprotein involved in thiamine biosynthesis [Candidatus Moranbacteria bacterium GW2011_GWA2_39_41]|nr:MAG: Membrane-associated lipoprotein involved in thiamine biosynthesis [Candidatus Moranbacteria bacterium GW2011_GWA2_39_41]